MRPNFEEPLDTAKQLLEENITLVFMPGFEVNKQWLLDSPLTEYKKLGEHTIIADDWDHFDNIIKHDILGEGTHAMLTYFLMKRELEWGEKYHPHGRGWHRSKETVARNPYAGFLTNRKWHLNEVSSKIKYI